MLWIVGGIVVGVTGLSAVTIAARWCPGAVVAMAQLLLPWWSVLTAVVVAVSAGTGTWGLAVAAAVVDAGALVVMAPKLRRTRSPVARPGDAATFSVVLANLYIDNPEPDEAIDQLLGGDPDILVMTELSTDLLGQFDGAGGSTRFPNRIHPAPIRGEYAVGIFTAHPTDDSKVWEQGPLQVVETTVDVGGGGKLRVIAVHPEAPVGSDAFRRWRAQLAELRRVLDEADAPTIVIGDFNSGTLQPPYERLVAGGFRDAHDLLGQALRPSWGVAPWLPRWFPTLLARLDHLLVNDGVTVVGLEDLDAVGSDHRPFRAELALGSISRPFGYQAE